LQKGHFVVTNFIVHIATLE